ncbi:CAP domain-containing protein [Actinoplanes sp. NPDC049265]|uniref:CAP domain-containing protein n=1 Tax=Actinoplanes sp. NPDC049265 TaxID=3363902 RepID=UPI003713C1C8
MRSRHRRPSRTRLLVLATCALGVLGAGAAGIASAQTTHHRPHAAAHTSPQLGPATKAVARAQERAREASRRPHPPRPTRPSSAPPATSAPADPPAPPSDPTTPPADPTTPPATPPSDPATPPAGPPQTTPPAPGTVIDQALAHINAARTANGLGTLTLSPQLTGASEAHNDLMVGGCGLSHQCPGEAGLGDRFTAAGVSWRSAGENIGQGNAANNPASILAAANGLTDLMLAEQPPNDGHRRNLLNPGFTRVGLAVTRGSDGRVWLTQDFVN